MIDVSFLGAQMLKQFPFQDATRIQAVYQDTACSTSLSMTSLSMRSIIAGRAFMALRNQPIRLLSGMSAPTRVKSQCWRLEEAKHQTWRPKHEPAGSVPPCYWGSGGSVHAPAPFDAASDRKRRASHSRSGDRIS